MRALSRRAHTTHEIQQKLRRRPHHTLDHEARIIARLKELNMLNDEEYIRRTIEQATQFTYQGKLKVGNKLYQKGIPFKLLDQIWNSMKVDEEEVAKKALKKIESNLHEFPKQKRIAKRAQFLAGRGFPPNIVFSLSKE